MKRGVQTRKRSRARARFSDAGLEIEGHAVKLVVLTGSLAEWECRIAERKRVVRFEWMEDGYVKYTGDPILNLGNTLYAALYTGSLQLMRAVFAGYKKGKPRIPDLRQLSLFPASAL